MSRRLLVWSAWGLTTAVATTVCWAGVSVVTASITPAQRPALPASEVHAALSAPAPPEGREPNTSLFGGTLSPVGAAGAPTAPPTGGVPASAPTPAPVAPLAAAAPPPPTVAQASRGEAPLPAPVISPAPPPASPPVVAPAPAVTSPPPSPPSGQASGSGHSDDVGGSSSTSSTSSSAPQSQSSAPQGQSSTAPVVATFSTSGGTVTVSCQASAISLISASPADGYTLAVRSSGPLVVDVDFNGQPSASAIRAVCNRSGQPVKITDE
jgi:hypothetical protein